MTPSQRQSRARERFLQWCRDHLSTSCDQNDFLIAEKVLICDGFFRGRRFSTEAFRGIWFLEEDVLKITDETGNAIARFEGDELAIDEAPAEVLLPVHQLPHAAPTKEAPARESEQPQRRAA